MQYEKIIVDLLNRIVTLEDRVAKLEGAAATARSADTELPAGSKKYRFLSDYLHKSNEARIELSYEEIEKILQFKLPDSALTHRAFWANTTSHSIALSWLSVNYEVVEVSLENKYIVFERKRSFEEMTIDNQMKTIVEEIICEYNMGYKISLKELYELLGARFGTNKVSVIPSDYCYNRTNKGIRFFDKPRLFRFLGDGIYECLGEGYVYDGPVYTREKGAVIEEEVGCWKDGNFQKNDKWDLYGLKF